MIVIPCWLQHQRKVTRCIPGPSVPFDTYGALIISHSWSQVALRVPSSLPPQKTSGPIWYILTWWPSTKHSAPAFNIAQLLVLLVFYPISKVSLAKSNQEHAPESHVKGLVLKFHRFVHFVLAHLAHSEIEGDALSLFLTAFRNVWVGEVDGWF